MLILFFCPLGSPRHISKSVFVFFPELDSHGPHQTHTHKYIPLTGLNRWAVRKPKEVGFWFLLQELIKLDVCQELAGRANGALVRQRKAESEISEHIKLRGTLQSLNGGMGQYVLDPGQMVGGE